MESGTVLGERFRLGRRLEETARGALYAAVDLEASWATCRVELLAAAGRERTRLEEYAAREVLVGRALADAEVEGLLPALAWGELDAPWLYVARAWGEELRPLDAATGALEERAWRLLAATRRVEGLAQLGGVHRDLGPGTLLEGPNEQVFLAGFALTRFPGVAEPAPDAWGLPFSDLFGVAPELLDAPAAADAAADVFALGALLHVALTGAAPYPVRSLPERIVAVAEVAGGRAPAPLDRPDASAPGPLVELCRAALTLDPARRLPTATAFAEQLEDWLAISTDSAPVLPAARAFVLPAARAAGPEAEAPGREAEVGPEPPADRDPPGPKEGAAASAPEAPARDRLDAAALRPEQTARLPIAIPPPPPEEVPQRKALWDPFASGVLKVSGAAAEPTPEAGPPPAALLPPVAFEGIEVHGSVLVFAAGGAGLRGAADAVARLDVSGFEGVLLDMRGAGELSPADLGCLEAIRSCGAARGFPVALFGVAAALRQALARRDPATLPRVLTATARTSAQAELLG